MFFRRLNWNVVGWFRTVSLISYAIIGAGVLMMALNFFQHGYLIKLGLSFTGGTDVTVKYTAPATTDAIKSAMASIGANDATVDTLQKSGDAQPNERYTISTQVAFGDDTQKLWTALGKIGTLDRKQSSIESIGPSLSHEYLTAALEALVIAILIQFGYIAFRFGWNYIFGLVVVIALVRDAAMMIGIYALAQKRADDAFLAAVLTVIGYSVMDTIVILDRIRENVKLMPGEKYAKIVNTSILQTMTRSVNTLATVIVTLVALLAFGGASLQNFAFALLVGICSGGYHSIFYSAPLVDVLRERQLKNARTKQQVLRASAGDRPRSVAEARAQAANATALAASRDEVLAARKERRAREKAATAAARGGNTGAGPARYKKRRPAGPTIGGTGTAPSAASPYETPSYVETEAVEADYAEHEYDGYDERAAYEAGEIDPLDAQQQGLHERELALGHQEIRLNLEAFDEEHAHEHDAEAGHAHGEAEGEAPAAKHE